MIVVTALAGCGPSLSEGMTTGGLAPTEQKAGAFVIAADEPAATATAAREAEALTAVTKPGSSAYKIGPQDVLDVSVFKVPELSRSVQVADSGTVNLPLVGEVPAAGRTAQEMERDLESKLGKKYLQSPQVSVYIKEYNSQRVTIDGAVKKPGVYPIKGKSTFLQVIAMAESVNPDASDEIVIFREINGKRSAAKFDISEIRAGHADDPPVQAGDLIVADTSTAKINVPERPQGHPGRRSLCRHPLTAVAFQTCAFWRAHA